MSPIDPDVAALIEEMRQAQDDIRSATLEVNAERAQLARESQAEEERRAEAARRGELGPHWQRLQQRIDLGETTVAAIMTGVDMSPDAQAIREIMVGNLADVIDESQTATDVPTLDAFESLTQTLTTLQHSLERLNDGERR